MSKINKNVVLKMLWNRESQKDVAKTLKINPQRVNQILEGEGLTMNDLKTWFALEDIQRIKRSIENGVPPKDINWYYKRNYISKLKNDFGFSVKQYRERCVLDAYDNKGWEPIEIASYFDISRTSVYKILNRNGKRRMLTNKEEKKRNSNVINDLNRGVSVKEVSKKYNITKSMVYYINKYKKTKRKVYNF